MAGLTTVTGGGISDGTITNADINASAAIDASKISGLSTDSITEGNTTVECVDTGSDGHITFDTEGNERMRIDSSGRLLIGAATTYVDTPAGAGGYNAKMYIAGSANNDNGLYMSLWNNSTDYDTIGVPLVISRSKGGTVGTFGALSSGNSIGTISFNGDDGDQFVSAAAIEAAVDGTPGNNDMPGRLVFSTTADGASSPTERMRILNNGTMDLRAATDVFNVLSNAAAGTTNLLIRGGNTATSFTAYTIPFGVYTNGNVVNTNNSYGSISDIKLKENIVDATSQWDDLKALQVRKYNFKQETGQQTHTQIGLIAQEAELVSPGLVSESPDRDEDGNDLGTVTKSVNYSVLYMKAVKALQEAIGRIETLEAKVAALEAAE